MNNIKRYIDNEKHLAVIEKAYLFAKEKHANQFRKTGDSYIVHLLAVANILADLYADYETLAAGFLHDVISKEAATIEEVEKEFSEAITKLVRGVTKLNKIKYSTENEFLIDYYKKIIVGMSEDVRVIVIKLSSDLHNMRTVWALDEKSQKEKAQEALSILAPIAHHLGIHKIKSELEDLALRYLKPDVFYDIAEKLNKTKIERDQTVYDMQQEVTNLLTEHNIKHHIKGRAKCIYSIYNKLNKGKKFSDIYDLFALRVLVDTEQECYLALGIIHSRFKPLPNRFKDYIAMPKPNMYQSLHTTVFGVGGYLFEIQIRTHEMDEVAENGIASHWSYKENKGSNTKSTLLSSTEQKLQLFKNIIESTKENIDNEQFVDTVNEELLNDNIYTFTPKGDVIELQKGSTPIDFAYKIHTKVGETMVGAIVNNNIVPLDYELQDGDVIKINTNKNSTPSKEWINIAKSNQTKNKIKSYFTKSEREIYIERGKYSLEKNLRRRKISFQDFYTDENIQTILDKTNTKDLDEVYLTIGNNKFAPKSIINLIFKEEKDNIKQVKITHNDIATDVIVQGVQDVKVNLANCCNPVKGDEIIGYITKNNGITVHRINCHNISNIDERLVEVEWNKKLNKKYFTTLVIYSNKKTNNMMDIMQTISLLNVSVDGIKIINKTGNVIYEVGCYVNGVTQLDKVIVALNNFNFIKKVERLIR